MFEIDNILASTFSQFLTEHLGERITKKVKEVIRENYNMSFEDAVADFDIMEKVLFDLFGAGYKGVVVNLLKRICTIENSPKNSQEQQYHIIIEDDVFFKRILNTMQDHDKKMILQNTFPTPLSTSEIISLVNDVPVMTVMKKIDELIEDRFLVATQTNDSEPKYSSTISETKVLFENDKLKMSVLFTLPLTSSKLLSYITN